MASECNEIVGATGNANIEGVESYQRVFEIIYDDPVFDSTIPLSDFRLPTAGSFYSPGSTARHVGRQARQSSNRGSPNHWTVTCLYSTQQATDQQDPQQDPELRAPRISWATNQSQIYKERDRKGERKCNSAGDPPIPITPTFESLRVATVRYFVRQKPAGLLSLINKINSNAFTVDGEIVDKHCCRIADIQCGEPRVEKGVVGRDITIQFQIGEQKTLVKANYIDQIGAASTVENNVTIGYWIPEMLDRGRRQIVAAPGPKLALIQDEFGNEPSEPSLLDGKGTALTTPVAVDSEVYRYWYDYEEADFSLIRLE
jgi:hypothetical protein